MISHFKTSQYVLHIPSGDVGQVYRTVLSPIGTEDTRGIKRLQVQTTVPGSDGHLYNAFDWWLPEDCVLLPKAPIAAASTVTVRVRGVVQSAVVLSTNYAEAAVMLSDGVTGWISLNRVQAVSAAVETSYEVAS